LPKQKGSKMPPIGGRHTPLFTPFHPSISSPRFITPASPHPQLACISSPRWNLASDEWPVSRIPPPISPPFHPHFTPISPPFHPRIGPSYPTPPRISPPPSDPAGCVRRFYWGAGMASCNPAILQPRHPAILPSCYPAILPSCHPAILPSGHPAILERGNPFSRPALRFLDQRGILAQRGLPRSLLPPNEPGRAS
jgi:hypothetical protein